MKSIAAEDAIKLSKPEFVRWSKSVKTAELKRIFSCCSMATHSQHWEVARLELDHRRHRVVFWGLVVMIVTAIFAAIAAWPVIKGWFS